jgi:MFS family permease
MAASASPLAAVPDGNRANGAAAGTTAPTAQPLGVIAQYGLLAGPLLSMLDSSIVNVAVAPIARELHAPLTLVGWVVSGYLLALGVGLAATSWLARRPRRHRAARSGRACPARGRPDRSALRRQPGRDQRVVKPR